MGKIFLEYKATCFSLYSDFRLRGFPSLPLKRLPNIYNGTIIPLILFLKELLLSNCQNFLSKFLIDYIRVKEIKLIFPFCSFYVCNIKHGIVKLPLGKTF
ncbi:hypothetical protein J2Y67_002543 [Neobacillus niacini]|nr:hypothetical protein [Neobacillus niacini]